MRRQLSFGLGALLVGGSLFAQDVSTDYNHHAPFADYLFDYRTEQIMWRGVVKDTLSGKPEKNTEKLDKASDKMFKDFPKHRSSRLIPKKRSHAGYGLATNITANAPAAGRREQNEAFVTAPAVMRGSSACSEDDYACGDCAPDETPHANLQGATEPNSNSNHNQQPPCQSMPHLLCQDFRSVAEALCASQQGQPDR